jgi:anthranilate synthase/aminodeoxychorismate synthase-like glutamine amidotransferase
MNTLLIDNNDSFTWNLEHLLVGAGATVEVLRYGAAAFDALAGRDLVVVSPGPGQPADYPGYEALVGWGGPVLGVCLGMQILNALEGGATGRLEGCVHGKADTTRLWGRDWTVGRYHSLWCTTVSEAFEVVGWTRDLPMAIRHRRRPWLGLQFHPESFLTRHGGALAQLALDDLDVR